jgi:hypothetical protein
MPAGERKNAARGADWEQQANPSQTEGMENRPIDTVIARSGGPRLNQLKRDLLQAAYILKALDERSLRSRKKIVEKADPAKEPTNGNINRAFSLRSAHPASIFSEYLLTAVDGDPRPGVPPHVDGRQSTPAIPPRPSRRQAASGPDPPDAAILRPCPTTRQCPTLRPGSSLHDLRPRP